MPVARSDPRRAVILALAAVVAAGALVFLAIGLGTEPRERTPFGPDDPEFNVGDAEARAATIERDDTPLLFQDPASFQNPIWVNHVGNDPAEGWVAFDAAIRDDCTVEWDIDADRFVDCDGTSYPPDGGSLPHYEVRVEDDDVIVDLRPDE